jgi:3,4-dihydroxy 2-butanone 4-phosphate synthase/GTP cyclohydrolase II
MRLLTNNPRKFVGLEGYGLSVSASLALEVPTGEPARSYLRTKKTKLGHTLKTV